jgi:plasmid maintenance system antidote protein VapI
LDRLHVGGARASLAIMRIFSTNQFGHRQPDLPLPSGGQDARVMLRGDAIPSKPVADAVRLHSQILREHGTGRPAGDNLLGGGKIAHTRHHNCQTGNRQDGHFGNCQKVDPGVASGCKALTKQIDPLANIPPEMFPAQVGKRMKQLREAHGLKPSEIADMIEVDRSHWTRFEKGQRAISDECAWKLVQRFDVTLDWLILGRMDKLSFDVAERLRSASA